MELTSPQDFIEKPVIDIEVIFRGAPPMGWTINDTPEAHFLNARQAIQFDIVETGERIRIERNNIAWSSIKRRIDRIPVPAKPPASVPDATGYSEISGVPV